GPPKRHCLLQPVAERLHSSVGEPAALGQRLGAANQEPEEPVAESAGGFGAGQVATQFLDGAVADDADVRAGRTGGCILRHRPEVAGLPSMADDCRESVALPLDMLEDGGELRFVDQQPLVTDAWIGFHVLVLDDAALVLDGLPLCDRIAHAPDESFAA